MAENSHTTHHTCLLKLESVTPPSPTANGCGRAWEYDYVLISDVDNMDRDINRDLSCTLHHGFVFCAHFCICLRRIVSDYSGTELHLPSLSAAVQKPA